MGKLLLRCLWPGGAGHSRFPWVGFVLLMLRIGVGVGARLCSLAGKCFQAGVGGGKSSDSCIPAGLRSLSVGSSRGTVD